jgi:CBS domain containing-hemolysin-like protein
MPFQSAFTWVFRPAVSLLNGSANALLRGVGIEPKEELSGARSAEELSSLVRRSASAGLLEEDTATLLGRTLRFADHDASDVMTPRPRVAAVQRLEPAEAVLELARQTGYSRFPVFDENLDDIVGLVHVKQAVAVPRERRTEVPASALQSEALRVPETMKLDVLLGELRARGFQMAVVVDEYGGTAGVATLEDLVEELVGEVADEHDRSRPGVTRRRDGSWLVPGLMRPDEVRERTAVPIPDGQAFETVGGFVMAAIGRIPRAGDEVVVDGFRVRVERMDGRRVDRVRLAALQPAIPVATGGPGGVPGTTLPLVTPPGADPPQAPPGAGPPDAASDAVPSDAASSEAAPPVPRPGVGVAAGGAEERS